MKKLFWVLTLFIVLNITTVYFFLFTSFGNGIVSGIVENNLNEKGVAKFKIETFVLTTDNINFKLTMDSNSVVEVVGDINIISKTIDLKYNIDVKDLAKLQKFTKQKLNGAVKASGTIKGDQALTLVNGTADIFEATTVYSATLKDFEPDTIKYSMKNAKIDSILYTVDQPIFAKGFIDISANITHPTPETCDGKVVTKIYDGTVNIPVVNKNFELALKNPINFKGDILTSLDTQQVVSKIDFFTSLANIFVKKAVVTIKDSSVNSDYQVKIADLNKLYDITNTKMKGAVELNGTVQKTKDLIVTGTSNIFKGKLDFRLKNNDLTATINNVEVKSLTDMLYYPQIFDSRANAKVSYDLSKASGTIIADLKNGKFIQNKFSYLVNQLARFDVTKEVYEIVDIKSNINKNIINSDINMKSKYTSIQTKGSILDTTARTVDSLVKTDIKGIKFDTKITGSLDNPKIKIDSSKLLESGAKQKVMEKIEEKIGSKLGGDSAKELMKGLNSLFK